MQDDPFDSDEHDDEQELIRKLSRVSCPGSELYVKSRVQVTFDRLRIGLSQVSLLGSCVLLDLGQPAAAQFCIAPLDRATLVKIKVTLEPASTTIVIRGRVRRPHKPLQPVEIRINGSSVWTQANSFRELLLGLDNRFHVRRLDSVKRLQPKTDYPPLPETETRTRFSFDPISPVPNQPSPVPLRFRGPVSRGRQMMQLAASDQPSKSSKGPKKSLVDVLQSTKSTASPSLKRKPLHTLMTPPRAPLSIIAQSLRQSTPTRQSASTSDSGSTRFDYRAAMSKGTSVGTWSSSKPDKASSLRQRKAERTPPRSVAPKSPFTPKTPFTQAQATEFPELGLLQGFKNLGNTCYLNAVLQALLSLETFTKGIVLAEKFVTGDTLVSKLADLVRRTETKHGVLDVGGIREVIGKKYPAFATNQQQDAHELLSTTLNVINDDLLAMLDLQELPPCPYPAPKPKSPVAKPEAQPTRKPKSRPSDDLELSDLEPLLSDEESPVQIVQLSATLEDAFDDPPESPSRESQTSQKQRSREAPVDTDGDESAERDNDADAVSPSKREEALKEWEAACDAVRQANEKMQLERLRETSPTLMDFGSEVEVALTCMQCGLRRTNTESFFDLSLIVDEEEDDNKSEEEKTAPSESSSSSSTASIASSEQKQDPMTSEEQLLDPPKCSLHNREWERRTIENGEAWWGCPEEKCLNSKWKRENDLTPLSKESANVKAKDSSPAREKPAEPEESNPSLYGLLEKYFRAQELELKCEKCPSKHVRVVPRFKKVPRIMVLHLKRFVPNWSRKTYEKFRDPIEFSADIGIDSFVADDVEVMQTPFTETVKSALAPKKEEEKRDRKPGQASPKLSRAVGSSPSTFLSSSSSRTVTPRSKSKSKAVDQAPKQGKGARRSILPFLLKEQAGKEIDLSARPLPEPLSPMEDIDLDLDQSIDSDIEQVLMKSRQTWTCGTCTFAENSVDHKRCAVCAAPRNPSPAKKEMELDDGDGDSEVVKTPSRPHPSLSFFSKISVRSPNDQNPRKATLFATPALPASPSDDLALSLGSESEDSLPDIPVEPKWLKDDEEGAAGCPKKRRMSPARRHRRRIDDEEDGDESSLTSDSDREDGKLRIILESPVKKRRKLVQFEEASPGQSKRSRSPSSSPERKSEWREHMLDGLSYQQQFEMAKKASENAAAAEIQSWVAKIEALHDKGPRTKTALPGSHAKPGDRFRYKLRAVCHHLGQRAYAGHYVTDIIREKPATKSPAAGDGSSLQHLTAQRYDDQYVSEITPEDAFGELSQVSCYILFYVLQEPPSAQSSSD